VLITITAVLIFRDIDVTFLTLIKAVDQKITGLALRRDQFFHNRNIKKKDMTFFMTVARMQHVLHVGGGVTCGSR
jgi:hypothetical protein